MVAAVDLGYVLRDVVTHRDLSAPARGVQAACLLLADQPDTAAWVDAGDAHANRPVPLPGALRDSLAERCDGVIGAALRVDSAGTFLGVSRQAGPADRAVDGRTHEARAISPPAAPGPGYGCDR